MAGPGSPTLTRGTPAAGTAAAPVAGWSRYLAAHLVLGLLTGAPRIAYGRAWGINLVAPDHRVVLPAPPRPDRPASGGGAR
jgi:hypothetical protein